MPLVRVPAILEDQIIIPPEPEGFGGGAARAAVAVPEPEPAPEPESEDVEEPGIIEAPEPTIPQRMDLSSREAFARTAYPTAKRIEQEQGIPAEILLAIPINETGLRPVGNSLYGIKGSSKRGQSTGQVPTWEMVNGQRVNTTAAFRAYESPEESMWDFADFLHENPRYARALEIYQETKDPDAFIRAVHQAGYATDSAWSDKIINLARQVKEMAGRAGGEAITRQLTGLGRATTGAEAIARPVVSAAQRLTSPVDEEPPIEPPEPTVPGGTQRPTQELADEGMERIRARGGPLIPDLETAKERAMAGLRGPAQAIGDITIPTPFGRAGPTVGSMVNRLLEGAQTIDENVNEPLRGLGRAAGLSPTQGANIGMAAPFGPEAEEARKAIIEKALERKPATPFEAFSAVWAAAGEYQKERPETFLGEKLLEGAVLDVLNLVPGLGVADEVYGRAGRALAQGAREAPAALGRAARGAGEAIGRAEAEFRAPGLLGDDAGRVTLGRKGPEPAGLPRNLAGAKPRYNIGTTSYQPQFESDVDKALFILAQTKPSPHDAEYLAWVQARFPDVAEAEIRAAGTRVRARIKELAQVQGEAGALKVPGTGIEASLTPTKPKISPEASAGTQRVREMAALEAEEAYRNKRIGLLEARGEQKALAAEKFSHDDAARFLKQLDAAPGDDPAARQALLSKYPDLVAPEPAEAALPTQAIEKRPWEMTREEFEATQAVDPEFPIAWPKDYDVMLRAARREGLTSQQPALSTIPPSVAEPPVPPPTGAPPAAGGPSIESSYRRALDELGTMTPEQRMERARAAGFADKKEDGAYRAAAPGRAMSAPLKKGETYKARLERLAAQDEKNLARRAAAEGPVLEDVSPIPGMVRVYRSDLPEGMRGPETDFNRTHVASQYLDYIRSWRDANAPDASIYYVDVPAEPGESVVSITAEQRANMKLLEGPKGSAQEGAPTDVPPIQEVVPEQVGAPVRVSEVGPAPGPEGPAPAGGVIEPPVEAPKTVTAKVRQRTARTMKRAETPEDGLATAIRQAVADEGLPPPVDPPALAATSARQSRKRPGGPLKVNAAVGAGGGTPPPGGRVLGGGGGTPPPRKPGTTPKPGGDPDGAMAELTIGVPGEDNARAALRKYDGQSMVEAAAVKRWVLQGDDLLRKAGLGKGAGGRQILSRKDGEALLKALHGEGEVPRGLEDIFNDLKAIGRREEADMLADDPDFAKAAIKSHPDYFPRMWREPEQTKSGTRAMGGKPFFKKPRNDATFTEMLDEGWEPLSWNPYDLLAMRRISGHQYRQQKVLVSRLKATQRALPADEAPREWRVPEVGPAFEGRPFVMGEGDEAHIAFTTRWAVPPEVANQLESIYGKKLALPVGPVDALKVLRIFNNSGKRVKLFGSLFQQIDFASRSAAVAVTPTGIARGAPVKYVPLLGRILGESFVPKLSGKLRKDMASRILSDQPLFEGSDISLRMIAEEGWNIGGDTTMFQRDIMDFLNNTVKEPPAGWKGWLGLPKRRINDLNRFLEQGLFDGVYREAQSFGLENFIVPALRRQHPDWTSRQIAGRAASEVNKMFSTLGVWQSFLQSPQSREFARHVLFSPNETESWLRQAGSLISGPNKRLWAEYGLGYILSMAIIGNGINYALNGEPLPLDAYMPVVFDSPYASWPGGVAYNDRLLSPKIPGAGRNGTDIYLDIVGQGDTAIRWILDPIGALESRLSTFGRALVNQIRGEDFWGRKMETGQQRLVQTGVDLYAPIGVGNLAEAGRQAYPETFGFLPEQEGRLGVTGSLIQTAGVNLRGAPTQELIQEVIREKGYTKEDGTPVISTSDLEPWQRKDLDKAIRERPALAQEMTDREKMTIQRGDATDKARGQLKQIDAQRITQEEALMSEWQGGKIASGMTFRARASAIQGEAAVQRARLDEAFQVFKKTGEKPPTDNERALVEYYDAWDKARSESGILDFETMEEAMARLESSWTAAQRRYVKDNTGITEHGPKYQAFVEAKKSLRPYFNLRDQAVKGNQRWQSLMEQRDKAGSRPALEAFDKKYAKALAEIEKSITKKREDWRRKNPERDKLLKEYGYVTKTMRERDAAKKPARTASGGGLRSR